MKIELSPEIEAGLATRAAAKGVGVPEYVAWLLMEQVAPSLASRLSTAERAVAWRQAAKGLRGTPPPSHAAIGRESIYGDRG
jgi:hypothetical protein